MMLKEIAKADKDPALLRQILAIAQSFHWSADATIQEWQSPYARLWIWDNAQDLVACCGGQILFEEANIHYFWVAPKHRGKGKGKVFLRALLDQFQENQVEKVNLEVRASNQAAIALYQALGFKIIDRRPNYYHDPAEDGWVMQLTIE
ncbi:ribosomal protein S18-alanine N-acetyltransferase [Facklamia sp. 7083-14-GEN3]|uniref:ribosomal protein S18-alanine N-acetyltransferase n=1 Tax=Facklamia sp. 7083-14-GEN3 TaxID=2973478 RepID=UPI00215C4FB0|nr:ribosomal protein S18-alanine N-acetyltransferase [Facklamia sp. 7083-14-GEN3]MCR8969572.1 ribosomal protein S18-alanine N-acetyltransferase [Facklamia sp. 7083-14-GEN3]